MTDLEKARATQIANIEKRSGKTMPQLEAIVKKSNLTKHGELVKMLKTELGMGHGDANAVVHMARKSDGQSAAEGLSSDQVLDEIYSGPKEAFRPIHDKLLKAMRKLGDFEEAPKKNYVSYRRKKQFVMIGPPTKSRVEVGLNMKGVEPTDRLLEEPPGKMCNYKVKLTDAKEVNAELIGWIKKAYAAAG